MWSAGSLAGFGDFLRFCRSCWQPYRLIAVLIIGLIVADKLFWAGFAFGIKKVIDDLAAGRDHTTLIWFVTGTLIGFPLVTLGTYWADRKITSVRVAMTQAIRFSIFTHIQSLSVDFFSRIQPGDLMRRFNTDIDNIEREVSERFIQSGGGILSVMAIVGLLFYTNWYLTPGVLILFGLVAWYGYHMTRRVNVLRRLRIMAEGQVGHVFHESVRGYALIKGFGLELHIARIFKNRLDSSDRKMMDAYLLQTRTDKSLILMAIYIVLLTMVSSVFLVIKGLMSTGTAVAFILLLIAAQKDVLMLVNHLLKMYEGSAAVQRLHELLQERIQVTDCVDAHPIPPLQTDIRFDDVSFSYCGEKRIIDQVSLTIPCGQFVAIVGPSGGGKSTFLKLLLRFYDVTDGKITVDGHDLRALTQQSFRAQMGVVFQETYLFDASIQENIRMFDPDVPFEQVEWAAEAAGIHEFITGLPAGYQTLVGDGGGWLSGGQRQRLAIARALVYNPGILILDEVTASLDASAAATVMASLSLLRRNRTIIAVTHNLNQTACADRILVFDKGHIVGDGGHELLLDQCPLYAQMWAKQNRRIRETVS